ncbi:hypothetical protein [Rhodovulum marinum]|nr:hypothetical protein [Rhodovulum marinum]
MHGASKILTVSYGTFSCTLEGFEDSFGTMKAIAEYFRDLAADDRFFGAEPPTPDAEMLQRIAEREIRKRVEARIGEDGIVLRPAAITSEDAPPMFAERTARPEAPMARADAGDRGADEPESVAAKLARIRAVVETARAAAPAPGPEGHPDPKSPDPVAEAPEMPHARPAAEPRAATGTPADGPGDAMAAAAPAAEAAMEPATAEPSAEDAPEDATARVLAALGRPAPRTPQPAAAPAPAPARARARVLKLKREDLAVHWPGAEAGPAQPEAARPAAEPAENDASLPDALEAELQAELAAARAAFDSPAAAETVGDGAAETVTAPDMPAPKTHAAETAEAAEAPVRGDVEQTETAEDTPLDTTAQPAEQTDADTPAPEAARNGGDAAPVTAPMPAPDPEQVETALQRLWDETNTKLDGAEQKRRRASIAHLKAAVAATFADRKSGSGTAGTAEDERARRPYRQVLAKVVRGNRDKASAPRPGESGRLAPLMLVSEQRVDADRPEPAAPGDAIRPRRVNTEAEPGEDAAQATTSAAEPGFAAFVAAREPAGIAGVLETAATYVQTVEGQKDFSRPQVLRLAMEHLGPDTSREEVLRAFGGLLRAGTFKKVKHGNFVMTTIDAGGTAPEAERRHA